MKTCLAGNADQKGMGILHHTTCSAPKQWGSSPKQHPKWSSAHAIFPALYGIS